MKRSLKIIISLIVAVILVVIVTIIGIVIHDYKNKLDATEALQYCYTAEVNGHKEMLIKYLSSAESSLSDMCYKCLFYKKWCATECCRIVVHLTSSEMVLNMSREDKFDIICSLQDIASYAYKLEQSGFNEYVKLISDYNWATIRGNINEFNDELLPTAERLLSENSKEPAICDMICKMFWLQKDYESVIKYASKYTDIAEWPQRFSMEIIKMYHASYWHLENHSLVDEIEDLSESLFNKTPYDLPYNSIQTFF